MQVITYTFKTEISWLKDEKRLCTTVFKLNIFAVQKQGFPYCMMGRSEEMIL